MPTKAGDYLLRLSAFGGQLKFAILELGIEETVVGIPLQAYLQSSGAERASSSLMPKSSAALATSS